jgi:tRNA threonylcarbamoyl adenosine modification protein (Sua5/YciO/YrdC/YwlC family)
MTRLARFDAGHVAFFPPGVVESLLAGGTAIYPTDTLYGLGVDPRTKEGLRRLHGLKNREGKQPIPLLLSGADRVSDWTERVPAAAIRLMEKFWPGGLTIVLPARPDAPQQITGGSGTVGSVPNHPIACALARALGGAITGTSANRTGTPATGARRGDRPPFTGKWTGSCGTASPATAAGTGERRSPDPRCPRGR